jgi:hypothetical protein
MSHIKHAPCDDATNYKVSLHNIHNSHTNLSLQSMSSSSIAVSTEADCFKSFIEGKSHNLIIPSLPPVAILFPFVVNCMHF